MIASEHVGILSHDFFPVLLVPKSNDRIAEIFHSLAGHPISLLPVWKIMWWTIYVDGDEGVIVKKVGPRVPGFNQTLCLRGEVQVSGVEHTKPFSFEFAFRKALKQRKMLGPRLVTGRGGHVAADRVARNSRNALRSRSL